MVPRVLLDIRDFRRFVTAPQHRSVDRIL